MTPKEVVVETLNFRRPPYVPWAWNMTLGCAERLKAFLQTNLRPEGLGPFISDHILELKKRPPAADPRSYRDYYGVIWDRSVDRNVGTPSDWPIKRPEDLREYRWPDAVAGHWYDHMPALIAANPHRFSLYNLSFSLYERAWTLRGMENLLTDMVERPEFVEELLDAVVEHDLQQISLVLRCGVDAVHFGDDYGMQTGLIMGLSYWRHFIRPRLAKLFAAVRDAGKVVFLHSCGRVDELFPELIEMGLNVFNPFQPEVMDVFSLMKQYHGRLAFHGGMGVQTVLPFGSESDVRDATTKLIAAGAAGGYLFSPSHSVPPDVPPENLIAMMEVLKSQGGYAGSRSI